MNHTQLKNSVEPKNYVLNKKNNKYETLLVIATIQKAYDMQLLLITYFQLTGNTHNHLNLYETCIFHCECLYIFQVLNYFHKIMTGFARF